MMVCTLLLILLKMSALFPKIMTASWSATTKNSKPTKLFFGNKRKCGSAFLLWYFYKFVIDREMINRGRRIEKLVFEIQ